MRTHPTAAEAVSPVDADKPTRLRRGTSWITVSDNVKRLVEAWEAEGEIAGSRFATRKDAIRCAVSLSLRVAGRHARATR